MGIDNGLGLASMKDATVSAKPVPPHAGAREIFTADDADGADGWVIENLEQVIDEIFVDDEGILMEINLVLCIGRCHGVLIADGHGGRTSNGNALDGEAIGHVQVIDIEPAFAVPSIVIDASNEGKLFIIQGISLRKIFVNDSIGGGVFQR